MKLRTRLLLPTLSVSLILLIFIVLIANLGYRNLYLQKQATRDLTLANTNIMVQNAVASLGEIGQIICDKPDLINALEMNKQFAVLDAIMPFAEQPMLDFAIIYDRHFHIFARSDRPGDFGHPDALQPHLEATAAAATPRYVVQPLRHKLAIVYLKPIISINGVRGAVAIGRYVDQSFLTLRHANQTLHLQAIFQDKPWGEQAPQEEAMPLGTIKQINNSGLTLSLLQKESHNRTPLDTRFGLILSLVVALSLVILYYSFGSYDRVARRISWVAEAAPWLVKGEFPPINNTLWEDDEIGSMVLAIEDANTAINQYVDDLNRSLHEKTTANQELQVARDAALEVAVAKSQFLSNMSHEIRTPMNGVIGILESIDSRELKPEHRDLIETAKQSGDDLIRIVNDILVFSKLDAGKDELELRPFNLATEMTRHVKLLTPSFVAHGLSLDLTQEIDAACAWVVGDSTRLGQILKNLVGNALKFSGDHGSVAVKVACRPLDAQRAKLTVKVRDHGIGIAPEHLESVFESFKQADGSVTRRFGGTGLGLAICQQLVRLMGGDIQVASTLGEGSEFSFTVPLAVAEAAATKPTSDLTSELALTPAEAANVKVLLVEDNRVNVIVAKSLLKKIGLRPDVASNGELAVAAATETVFDVILMDCQMPVMDGYEATRQLRKLGVNVPIIALTANAMPGDRQKCLDAGMDNYLTKPLKRDQLVTALNDSLATAPSYA